MLRITTQIDPTGTIFLLEGNLAGPWVAELKSCWQRMMPTQKSVRVVLKTVTFVDDSGKRLLADMHRQGVKLTAEGCMTRAIVEEIVRGER